MYLSQKLIWRKIITATHGMKNPIVASRYTTRLSRAKKNGVIFFSRRFGVKELIQKPFQPERGIYLDTSIVARVQMSTPPLNMPPLTCPP